MDRLSVSFAPDDRRTSWSDVEIVPPSPAEIASDISVRVNVFNMAEGAGPGGGSPSPILASGHGNLII